MRWRSGWASRGRVGAVSGQILLLGSLAAVGSAASAFWYWNPLAETASAGGTLVEQVVRGPFVHDVVERGELESSNNVLVRCEVESRAAGSNGVKIIEIVPEGSMVKKGDFLIRFDAAALQTERTTQLINVGSAEAAAAQSQNDLTAAVIARKEYEFGEFETEREKLNGEMLVASENASRAEETVEHSEKLTRRGYLSRSKLRSDRFDLAKAKSDLKMAQVKLNALLEYTKPKKLSELDSKVKTCEAKLKSDEAKLALEQQKLQVLDEQIAKCVVNAPVDGQVIYDHERDDWGGSEYQIKQGAVMHEQRVVIRLPDPKQMQVVAKVAEARIDRIKVGMPATIEIEGLPGVQLTGEVTRVNEYPAPENWLSANVKEYATTVKVLNPPEGLRPGMTARAAIRVETIDDALQVPIQAVVEQNGTRYCLCRNGTRLVPRQVLTGGTNEKFIVVRDGLTAGEQVLLNPRAHLASVDLAAARPVASAALQQASVEKPETDATAKAGSTGL